jgi:hypothetical protein
MAITNQQTLRDTIADWLNRSDLTTPQIDSFISAGESKIYDVLRIPPLETTVEIELSKFDDFLIPSDFIEAIDFRKVNSTNNFTILNRTDPRALYDDSKPVIPNAFARELDYFVITGSTGEVVTSGTYQLKYYRYLPMIGDTYDNGSVFETDESTCDALSSSTYNSSTGECTITSGDVEIITYLVNGDPDLVLYASLWVASDFLNDDEGSMRYSKMFFEKVDAISRRNNKSEMSGGNVTIKLPHGIG